MSQPVLPESCDACLHEIGVEAPRTLPLPADGVCRIGRDVQNTLVVRDDQVSRHHAMIHRDPVGDYYLTDLGSRNGTAVNQRPITGSVLLKLGDLIGFGKHQFVFHCCQPTSPTASQKQASYGETIATFDQQLITVVVADIRDFTGLAQRLGETRLSEVLSGFIRHTGAALRAEGAWGQKYIGDAVMAVWVHTRRMPELSDALRIFCGLERLFQIVGGLQSEFNLPEPIRIGAGVNTGIACLGNMGSEAAADYTALSEAVNRAFRLESTTKQGGWDLAIGRRTYEFLQQEGVSGDLFQPHEVTLKGYREAQILYASFRRDVGAVIANIRRKLESSDPAVPGSIATTAAL